jgi:hypothetical protein
MPVRLSLQLLRGLISYRAALSISAEGKVTWTAQQGLHLPSYIPSEGESPLTQRHLSLPGITLIDP